MATTKKKKTKAAEHVYVLRCCLASMISTNGFRWPGSGQVECPDWSAEAKCGNGLHGWLWGEGNISVATGYDDPASRWLVVKVARADVVSLDGKVKFPRGEVVFCGDRSAAAAEIRRLGATGAVIGTVALSEDAKIALTGGARSTLTGGDGSTLTGGDGSTLTGGYGSTLTGGDGSTLTGGYGSTLTGGDGSTLTGGYGSTLTGGARSTLTGGARSTLTGGARSTLTGGDGSTLTGGDGSTLTGGYGSTLTGGDGSTLTGGYGSTLTGGARSTLTGGARSTLTGGDGSTLTGGDGSTLTGGESGSLQVRWWDGKRYRVAVFYVGEDGIEAGVAYVANDRGEIVRAK